MNKQAQQLLKESVSKLTKSAITQGEMSEVAERSSSRLLTDVLGLFGGAAAGNRLAHYLKDDPTTTYSLLSSAAGGGAGLLGSALYNDLVYAPPSSMAPSWANQQAIEEREELAKRLMELEGNLPENDTSENTPPAEKLSHVKEATVRALKCSSMVKRSYTEKQKGTNSEGEETNWVIKSHDTDEVIGHYKTEEDAEEALQAMHANS